MSLNQKETEALDGFTKALKPLFDLPPCHPSDTDEMVRHVHAIQAIVLARSAVRADLDRMSHTRRFCGAYVNFGSFGERDQLCTETDHAKLKDREF